MMLYSCGIIPFRRNDNGNIEFFVGHCQFYGVHETNYWGLLKGCKEGEETFEETALREFKEESGVVLKNITKNDLIPLGSVKQNKKKIVVAFGLYYPNIKPSECVSNISDDGVTPEIDTYAWMGLEEISKKTHPTHIQFYEQINNLFS